MNVEELKESKLTGKFSDLVCCTKENSSYTEIQIYILNRYLACWKQSASWPEIIKDLGSKKYDLCSPNEYGRLWPNLENLFLEVEYALKMAKMKN